jgi:hypothetical protein
VLFLLIHLTVHHLQGSSGQSLVSASRNWQRRYRKLGVYYSTPLELYVLLEMRSAWPTQENLG